MSTTFTAQGAWRGDQQQGQPKVQRLSGTAE